MDIDINNLSESELVELNRRVVERIRMIRQARAQATMLEFNIGDRVCFETNDDGLAFGIVVRHNKKSVSVNTEDGGRWTVHPSLLRPVVDVSGDGSGSETVVTAARDRGTR